jgi:large subunit ribosomal protein L31
MSKSVRLPLYRNKKHLHLFCALCYTLLACEFTLQPQRWQGGREEVDVVKAGIHPNYQVTTITCACGNVIETGSIKKNIRVEICSACHPFFTGKQKFVDAGGRVDRFKKKYNL